MDTMRFMTVQEMCAPTAMAISRTQTYTTTEPQ